MLSDDLMLNHPEISFDVGLILDLKDTEQISKGRKNHVEKGGKGQISKASLSLLICQTFFSSGFRTKDQETK